MSDSRPHMNNLKSYKMNLPEKIYLSLADFQDLRDELDYDFSRNPDVTGSTEIHREYLRNDDEPFQPGDWGWIDVSTTEQVVFLHEDGRYYLCPMNSSPHFFQIFEGLQQVVRYQGPLTPTIYRLIAGLYENLWFYWDGKIYLMHEQQRQKRKVLFSGYNSKTCGVGYVS